MHTFVFTFQTKKNSFCKNRKYQVILQVMFLSIPESIKNIIFLFKLLVSPFTGDKQRQTCLRFILSDNHGSLSRNNRETSVDMKGQDMCYSEDNQVKKKP